MTAKRVFKFIGAVFLAWIIGTLIHAWRLGQKGVVCCYGTDA